jgi:hypothetical protein
MSRLYTKEGGEKEEKMGRPPSSNGRLLVDHIE